MNAKIGIREVAAHAGVSLGTVSNVLNGLPSVTPRNADKVRRAMDELGFVPNANARQLRASKTNSIGMVVLNIANPFFAEVAHDAQGVAESHGTDIVIASSDQEQSREDRYLGMFEESRVRGLIVAPVNGVTQRMQQVAARGTPIVLLDEHVDAARFCSVSLDGTVGGYTAARHLIDLGRRRLGFVGGPLLQVADRVSGVGKAIAESPGAILAMFETPDLTVEQGRAAAHRIAALPERDRPDGVFAGNDLVALGLLQGLAEQGISVPDDIALVGYDDIDYARTAAIPLTSIAQPHSRIAEEAIRLLLEEESDSGGAHQHQEVRLTPELVVRASTVSRPTPR
ncbi:LacI family DNA-binding transcriptional regulator [Agromyces mangrovi Wang et al. 2018]|uniref:LacI family DNA-binding transcriptional regulator n=1 Tax=Agromyces mangrovi TaxID=1858653 RepID=UPI00257422AD|nr:LacI family DNA-binding transcriptional regulator [Agromyces mangrovi]BDZ64438.1 LacI family transcriptional regulator [Agromyces mangrovi]